MMLPPRTCRTLGALSVMSSSPFSPIRTFSAGRSNLAWEKMAEKEGAVSQRRKVLTIDTMNANVKKVEYAVRGPIVQRAVQLEKELREVRCVQAARSLTRAH